MRPGLEKKNDRRNLIHDARQYESEWLSTVNEKSVFSLKSSICDLVKFLSLEYDEDREIQFEIVQKSKI